MLINMKSLAVGPAFMARPGDVVDVSAEFAASLIAGGYGDAPTVLAGPADETEPPVDPPKTGPLARRKRSK